MKRLVLLVSLSLVFVACAADSYHDRGKWTFNEYEEWTSEPTPEIWKSEPVWTLVLLNRKGEILRSLTVRFTDQEADSCIAGKWLKAEIIAERPERSSSFLGKPAYYVTGSYLELDLSANLCDSYYPLRGHLTIIGLSGMHGHEGMFGGEILGRFYGTPTY